MNIIALDPHDYHQLVELQRQLHNRQNAMSLNEQRDVAERLRLLLAKAEPVEG